MKVLTCTNYPDDKLEPYRPQSVAGNWELAISGYWSEDTFHAGHIAYFVRMASLSIWVMNAVERNAELDDLTQEDVDAGRLNDDQIQAMWGFASLEDAQNHTHERIVAVLLNAPTGLTARQAAKQMYDAVQADDGKSVDEPDALGLLGD